MEFYIRLRLIVQSLDGAKTDFSYLFLHVILHKYLRAIYVGHS